MRSSAQLLEVNPLLLLCVMTSVCCLRPRRLSPVDYHRLHTPVTGVLRKVSWAGRTLYAVEVGSTFR
jgi:hypothetical protein